MKLRTQRETLLKPLQAVVGVVERRQTMPILANVLMVVKDGTLSITGTDLEVELVATTDLPEAEAGEVTVPGRKLLDICRALPEGADLTFTRDGERVTLRSGRSRFVLSTLAAAEFPTVEDISAQTSFRVSHPVMRRLVEKTHFSMAHQDVRYYLNGLLLEIAAGRLRAVATDGHRLAVCEVELDVESAGEQQVIVPRKGVLELQRLLGDEGELTLRLGSNHVQMELDQIRFTSKLIDGRFPDYTRVIPDAPTNRLTADRDILRRALSRAAILSNEKYRGIRLELSPGKLVIQAHNPEQEEAEEMLEVDYAGPEMEIGFNVGYVLDALAAVDGEQVELGLSDANSSCLIHAPGNESARYVVMPMRL